MRVAEGELGKPQVAVYVQVEVVGDEPEKLEVAGQVNELVLVEPALRPMPVGYIS